MLKAKEMKDDAIVQIPISKGYYMMVKALAYNLVSKLLSENKSEDYLNAIGTKDYVELDDDQRSLRTVTLLVAEIEAQAKHQNKYVENEVLEPGDEGYVAPTIED